MPSDSDFAIRGEDLWIRYRSPVERTGARTFMPWRSTRKSSTLGEAVRGVSFDVPRGEVLGIVGRNGSGKSTLLRAIAGVIAPSDGRITIRGRVAPLLSVGTGFNNALSGRDNITLGCLALGLEPAEIDRRADGIAEFTGLGDALESEDPDEYLRGRDDHHDLRARLDR